MNQILSQVQVKNGYKDYKNDPQTPMMRIMTELGKSSKF